MKKMISTKTGVVFSILFSSALYAAGQDSNSISFFLLATGLFGGMGMFLYGMEMMSDGMKVTAGNSMRTILEKLTSNKYLAVFVGAFVTMVIQSSSATTVMLVSFVNSGLLAFSQALGVILGSNIGSTVTAQIVAFKVTDYALLLIAAGALMSLFSKKDTVKNLGYVILGFGLLFYGMKVMSDTMKPLRSDPAFNSILTSFENPFLGILAGAIFTALVQSSSATTGIVITLASGGSITLEAGIPLIFGANLGTCITALLAGLNASRDAKRVAVAHITFNLIGVLLFCFWIPTFADWVSQTSQNIPRQIANAHTFFNIIASIVFLPFTGYIAKAIIHYFPDKELDRNIEKPAVLHLDESLLDQPTAAINNAQAEIKGVVGLMERVVGTLVRPFINGQDLNDIENEEVDLISATNQRVEKIDFLNDKITEYLVATSKSDLSTKQSKELFTLTSIVNYLSSMNDLMKLRFSTLVSKKDGINEDFSPEDQDEILKYHQRLIKQVKRLDKFFAKFDKAKAEKIIAKGKENKDLEQKYRLDRFERISSQDPSSGKSADLNQLHTQVMDLLKQVNIFIELIASSLLELESE
ncbi:MAG: Na/Pi cotransporter family protein [Candidatus Neomarinimicrobiota bacterium]|nr:Na/Pi cotransporter family protein [Candidatus Neomarinimicrobiota bacterium]|tara:strand:+ start:6821 stop:8572 length:1752 start_codon:yes stop_codon:yes gene_type:complete